MKRFVLPLAAFALVWSGCSNGLPTDVNESAGAGIQPLSSGAEFHAESIPRDGGDNAGVRTYKILIENLTPATGDGSSQPFSPPVLATHHPREHLFREGEFASKELAQIAEDAVNGPLLEKLNNSARVHDVVEGGGVILPGATASFEIQIFGASRRLSAVFMLVNTNDGFGGLDGVKLPINGERVFYVHAYDAGSEFNSELLSDIPGPCCGSPGEGTDTRERVQAHTGILGVGDLDPDTWGWTGPVARVTVKRLM